MTRHPLGLFLAGSLATAAVLSGPALATTPIQTSEGTVYRNAPTDATNLAVSEEFFTPSGFMQNGELATIKLSEIHLDNGNSEDTLHDAMAEDMPKLIQMRAAMAADPVVSVELASHGWTASDVMGVYKTEDGQRKLIINDMKS